MKKPRQKVRADEPVLIGFSGSSYVAPEPRMTAFVWSNELNLEAVEADEKGAQ